MCRAWGCERLSPCCLLRRRASACRTAQSAAGGPLPSPAPGPGGRSFHAYDVICETLVPHLGVPPSTHVLGTQTPKCSWYLELGPWEVIQPDEDRGGLQDGMSWASKEEAATPSGHACRLTTSCPLPPDDLVRRASNQHQTLGLPSLQNPELSVLIFITLILYKSSSFKHFVIATENRLRPLLRRDGGAVSPASPGLGGQSLVSLGGQSRH